MGGAKRYPHHLAYFAKQAGETSLTSVVAEASKGRSGVIETAPERREEFLDAMRNAVRVGGEMEGEQATDTEPKPNVRFYLKKQ